MIGLEQLSLLIMVGPHWGYDNYRPLDYLSDFADNWLKRVYMCQNDTYKSCLNQIIHSKVTIKNANSPYMAIIGWDLLGSVWKSSQPLTRNLITQ